MALVPRFLTPLLVLLAVALPSARATLTFDLRLVNGGGPGGGPKSHTGLTVNQVLNLELWAVVTGSDANANNDGFESGYVSILSDYTPSSIGIRGNLSATRTVTFSASQSQQGTAQDLDGDGDKDVGSNLSSINGDFMFAKAGSMQTTSGTAITGGREFKLFTLTFTVISIANPLDPTPIHLFARVTNFTSPIETEARWQQDGITSNDFFMEPTSTWPDGSSMFPTVGAPVLLRAIPEPASATLLLLAAAGLLNRRLRTAV